MDEDDSSEETTDTSTGPLSSLTLDERRRSFLKHVGGGVGLAALGGSAVGTAGASHSSTTFQIDLVNGTPGNLKDPLDETGNFYSDDGTLIRWIWGDDSNTIAEGDNTTYDGGTFDGATVTTRNGVNIDFSTNTASVEFTVSGGTVDLSLVCYTAPSNTSVGWEPSNASDQRIHDVAHGTFDNDGSLTVALPLQPDRVPNHDMESGDLANDNPDDWNVETFDGSGSASYVDAVSRTGSRSIKIQGDPGTGLDGRWNGSSFPVDPNRTYEASTFVKTNNVVNETGADAVATVRVPTEDRGARNFTGTNPWTQATVPFKPSSLSTSLHLYMGYFGQASGEVWFDDAVVTELPGRVYDDRLEAFYSLDGSTATNSVTGTDATVEGEASINKNVPGLVDDAWEFSTDGDVENIQNGLTSGENLPLNGEEATVALWFRYTGKEGFSTPFQVGGSRGNRPGSDGYNTEFDSTNDTLVLKNYGSAGVSPETWIFLVVVIDGDDGTIYTFDRNGLLGAGSGTDSGRNRTGSEPLHIAVGDDREVAGKFDEIRGYSRALTEQEVWRLYQGTLDQVNNVQAYYSLDGSTATNAITSADASTNGSPTTGVTGIKNSAWEFAQANDDGLQSGTNLQLNARQATVAGWVNFTDDGSGGIEKADFARLYQVGGSFSGTGEWQVRFEGGNDDVNIEFGSGTVASTDTLSPGTWYFITAVVDDGANEGRIHVYDQSSELSNSPYTGNLDSVTWNQSLNEPLHLMRGDGRTVSGTLDEVYAYGEALSASEVDTLYTDSQN